MLFPLLHDRVLDGPLGLLVKLVDTQILIFAAGVFPFVYPFLMGRFFAFKRRRVLGGAQFGDVVFVDLDVKLLYFGQDVRVRKVILEGVLNALKFDRLSQIVLFLLTIADLQNVKVHK